MTARDSPQWICLPCGKRYGHGPRASVSTWHVGECGVCGVARIAVTEQFDFVYLRDEMNGIEESRMNPYESGAMVDMNLRNSDRQHTYVRNATGCGHGRLFSEPCADCELVGLMEEYKRAIRTVMRVRNRMRQLGRPLPGQTS